MQRNSSELVKLMKHSEDGLVLLQSGWSQKLRQRESLGSRQRLFLHSQSANVTMTPASSVSGRGRSRVAADRNGRRNRCRRQAGSERAGHYWHRTGLGYITGVNLCE